MTLVPIQSLTRQRATHLSALKLRQYARILSSSVSHFGNLNVSDIRSVESRILDVPLVSSDGGNDFQKGPPNFPLLTNWRNSSVSPRVRSSSREEFPGKRHLFLKASSDFATLQYLENENEGVAVISLNRPEARNAIGAEMLKQLHSILEGMRHASSARVLIVCSTVPGIFCAGADLKERRKMGVSETEKFVSSLRSTFSSLEELQIPTIAVIEGPALGGGLELALACDLRVCGEEAVFGLPETSLAIIPGAGGTQRLPRVIGRSRAKELIFTADRICAKRAEAIGLVDHCVQEGEAYHKALEIAQKILEQGPLAVKVAKHAIDHGVEMDATKGMLFEEACYSRLLRSTDRLEGLAAFAEKRKPIYRGE